MYPGAAADGVFVLDDTSFPKRDRSSVGVSHQYCGTLGKRANCQVAVTLHYCGPRGRFPLDLRLHLPESWTDDARRMSAAGVPEAFRAHRTKSRSPPGVARSGVHRSGGGRHGGRRCAGYGGQRPSLRDGLASRGVALCGRGLARDRRVHSESALDSPATPAIVSS